MRPRRLCRRRTGRPASPRARCPSPSSPANAAAGGPPPHARHTPTCGLPHPRPARRCGPFQPRHPPSRRDRHRHHHHHHRLHYRLRRRSPPPARPRAPVPIGQPGWRQPAPAAHPHCAPMCTARPPRQWRRCGPNRRQRPSTARPTAMTAQRGPRWQWQGWSGRRRQRPAVPELRCPTR